MVELQMRMVYGHNETSYLKLEKTCRMSGKLLAKKIKLAPQ
jgi:hypothetical protein